MGDAIDIEMAELYNELNAPKTLLEQRNRELTILGQISQALTESFDPEIMPRMIFKSILMAFQTAHGSMLEYHPNGKDLADKYIMGFNRDPLGIKANSYLSYGFSPTAVM